MRLSQRSGLDEVERYAEYGVDDQEKLAFEPGRRAVPRDRRGDQDGYADGRELDRREDEIHLIAEEEAHEDENRSDEQRDLQAASYGDLDGGAHFVLHSQHNRRAMFRGIADDGDDECADEQFGQAEPGRERIQRMYEPLAYESDHNGRDEQEQDGLVARPCRAFSVIRLRVHVILQQILMSDHRVYEPSDVSENKKRGDDNADRHRVVIGNVLGFDEDRRNEEGDNA